MQRTSEVNPIDYLERYSQTPQLKVLVKMGLTDVVEKLVKCYYGIVADENARRPVSSWESERKE